MLQKHTVEQHTLELLKVLMHVENISEFRLAGGTALALQLGHRMSYDLDLFCNCNKENETILASISHIKPLQIISQSKNIFILNIQNIKVDFVKYQYHFIEPMIEEEKIRLTGLKDIAAMKLSAITGRGRKRDFTDLYFLLQKFSLKEILEFYTQKYSDGNELMVLRSLLYFDDADIDAEVNFISEKTEWNLIKEYIRKEVNEFLSINN